MKDLEQTLSLMMVDSVQGIYSMMRLRKVSYFSAVNYVIHVLVEMVMKVHDVRVVNRFHYLQLSVFVLFVLVYVLYCHLLLVFLHVFCLLFTIQLTKYTHPNVPLPTICIFWYLFCCILSFFIFISLFTNYVIFMLLFYLHFITSI